MRVTVPQDSIAKFLRWSCAAMFAASALTLSYSAFVLADTWMFQRQAGHEFDQIQILPASLRGPALPESGLMGRLEIPRLGLSVIVAEGTGETTLRRAAGHIAGTSLPGHAGNVGIAGHRDALFRPLRNILPGDVIMMSTLLGEYRYRVVSTKIVAPSDVTVLNTDRRQVLTLVTCYPFYFVGPAPNRFVVRAVRVLGTI
jgi:sortase A